MIWALLACESEQPWPLSLTGVPAERVVTVGQPVVFSADARGFESIAWYTGDGAVLEEESPTWTYQEGGHYDAYVVLTAANGEELTANVLVTAVWPAADPAPRVASTMAWWNGAAAFVLPESGSVWLYTGSVSEVPVCEQALSLAVDGEALVVACAEDLIVELSPSGESRAVLDWGTRPRAALSTTVFTESLRDEGSLALVNGALWVSRWRSPDGVGLLWKDGAEVVLEPDAGPDSDVDARGVPGWLGVVAARPDGRALVYGGLKSNVDRGLYLEDRAFTFDTVTRSKLVHVDTDGQRGPEPLFDNRDRVGALAYNDLGDRLAVAHFGTGVVDILDSFTMATSGGIAQVGLGLSGLLWDGDELLVLASLDRELVRYAFEGSVGVEIERVAIPAEPVHPGMRVFYDASDLRMSAHGYMSCGSCHLDGSTDNLTWDFTDRGEGLRNTTTMLGRGGAVPLHWTANFDEVQDFEKNIRESQGGTGFLSEEDWAATADPLGAPKAGLSPELDALAEWLESLDTVPRSPWREPDGSWPEEAEAGAALFVEAGCDSCHGGPEFSDSAFVDGEPVLWDVGTLGPGSGQRLGEELTGLDTPSLRGLHDTAPYLHDGSALTVEAAIRRMPGGEALNDDERAALGLYLLGLE